MLFIFFYYFVNLSFDRYTGAALEALAVALRSEEGKKCFIHHHGMNAVTPMLGSVSVNQC